jgi:hypothetical protein
MNVEIGGHVALDLVEELAELHRAVPGHAFADDGSGLHDQRTSPGECMNLQFLIRMRRLFALVGLVASDKNGKAIVEPPQVRCWQCAPKARIISGGGIHPESCRLIR